MITERIICGLPIDVNVNEGRELFLPEEVASRIGKGEMGDIIRAIYETSGKEYVPLSVFMEVTDRCNFNCPFCYIN